MNQQKLNIESALEGLAETSRDIEPWDTSDMAYRPNGLTVEQAEKQEPVVEVHYFGEKQIFVVLKQLSDGDKLYTAPPKREWVGLDENDFEYQPPQTVLTMKFAEAILRDRNK